MPYRIQSVERAVLILDEMVEAGRGVTRQELADATGINANTLFRFLAVLMRLGLVHEERVGRTHLYRLTPRIYEWGQRWIRQFRLAELARPHLVRLARETGETVNLGVRSGRDVAYMAREDGGRRTALTVRTGGRVPLHATALGKIFLAEDADAAVRQLFQTRELDRFTDQTLTSLDELLAVLAQVRRDGVAFDREELEPGVVCVAAGIRDGAGQLAGGLSCSAPRLRADDERCKLLAEQVKETAKDVSRDMGWSQPRTSE